MTTASCRCANGHEFVSRLITDEPGVNATVVEDEECPDCGADFTILELNYDDPD